MWKNKLFYGDNLEVLRKYIKDDSIDLCYIDPPFNSNRTFNQIYLNHGEEDKAQAQAFVDTWFWDEVAAKSYDEIIQNEKNRFPHQTILLVEGLEKVLGRDSLLAYLVHMTLRITEIHRVLKSTGSFYLHCDTTASHYLKLIVDSIFCSQGGEYQNEITWKRYAAHSLSTTRYDSISDIIFFYTKSEEAGYFKPDTEKLTKEEIEETFPHIELETGRRYQHASLEKSSNASSKGEVRSIQGRKIKTSLGWVWSQETFDERIKKNPYLIYWTNSGRPRYKIYVDEYEGRPIGNFWSDIPYLSSGDLERQGYPTQKPTKLLRRIIKAGSKDGDTILDAYCGCGTTIVVSEQMHRKWIGIDITYQSFSLVLKRLEDEVGKTCLNNIESNGVPKDWESAKALAEKEEDKTRKEFEKWAVLFYSNNRARINEKKGGDKGIDGTALIQEFDESKDVVNKKIIFSVKSDKHLKPAYVRELKSQLTKKDVVMGVLICLYEPTREMLKEAKETGIYKNNLFQMDFPEIQIVTVREMFDSKKRLTIPVIDIVKKAEYKGKEIRNQSELALK